MALLAYASTAANAPLVLRRPAAGHRRRLWPGHLGEPDAHSPDITRATAGVAAGVYETGVRVGTAVGTAIAGALFFGTLASTHGDYHAAVGLA